MASGHGGRRAGAGRKPTRERFAAPIARAEKRIADRLPRLVENLEELADGGYQRTKQKWEPAGLVFVDGYLKTDDGDFVRDRLGLPVRGQVPAFPDNEPTDLVLIEQVTETADRDRQANIYLVDRILGKPVAVVEADVTTDGAPIAVARPDFTSLSIEELRQLERLLTKAADPAAGAGGAGAT